MLMLMWFKTLMLMWFCNVDVDVVQSLIVLYLNQKGMANSESTQTIPDLQLPTWNPNVL